MHLKFKLFRHVQKHHNCIIFLSYEYYRTKRCGSIIRTSATAINIVVDLLPGSGLEFSMEKETGSLIIVIVLCRHLWEINF